LRRQTPLQSVAAQKERSKCGWVSWAEGTRQKRRGTKREREVMGRAGGISKGAKALRLTHCVCGATKVMAAAAAAAAA
jgi:hypothetical protein